MKKIVSKIGIVSFVLFFTSSVMAEISIIVHPDNAVAALNEKAAKKIFLGKSKKFPGGGKVQPIDQSSGATKDAFHAIITKKNAAKLKSYWSRMVFTGKAQAPAEVSSDADVIAKVASNPKAIGYVDSGSVTDSVKVIMKIP